jgi:Family of unknown function (DUF6152)
MRSLLAPACVSAVLLAAASASAHHGWGGYDATQVLTVTGKIQEMTYANPHGTLKLEAPGKVWIVTLAPPFRMQNRGLPSEALKVGTTVTVVGYPNRTEPTELRAERITVNGQTTELR